MSLQFSSLLVPTAFLSEPVYKYIFPQSAKQRATALDLPYVTRRLTDSKNTIRLQGTNKSKEEVAAAALVENHVPFVFIPFSTAGKEKRWERFQPPLENIQPFMDGFVSLYRQHIKADG